MRFAKFNPEEMKTEEMLAIEAVFKAAFSEAAALVY